MSNDGLMVADNLLPDEVASYSTGSQERYFDWQDAPGLSSRELADLFKERFPLIVQKGKGRDWAYAGWLTEVLGGAEREAPSGLPIFFADYPIKLDPAHLPPPVRFPIRSTMNWPAMFGNRGR